MIDQMGGRKLVALTVMVLLGVGAVLVKGDIPPNFLSLLEWVFGGFVIGNGLEHMTGAYTEVNSQDTPPDTSHALLDAVNAVQSGVSTVQQTLAAIIQRVGIK